MHGGWALFHPQECTFVCEQLKEWRVLQPQWGTDLHTW
jgi:hypothetical protein